MGAAESDGRLDMLPYGGSVAAHIRALATIPEGSSSGSDGPDSSDDNSPSSVSAGPDSFTDKSPAFSGLHELRYDGPGPF